MTWCEANGIDYIFGVAGNAVLDRLVEAEADDIRVRRAEGRHAVMRGSGTIPAMFLRYSAEASWQTASITACLCASKPA